MCYDKEAHLRSQIKRAIHDQLPEETIDEMKRELWILTGEPYYEPDGELDSDVDEWPGLEEFDYYHVSGFSRPAELVYTSINPVAPVFAYWGFIGQWVDYVEDMFERKSNFNLNAQSANMFKSRNFGNAAKWGRCVVMIDAYYESHHYKRKTYPFRIYRKDKKPMFIASIYHKNIMKDEDGMQHEFNTFAMLTCKANGSLARIHNNPEMVERTGHRMLCILKEEDIDKYLKPYPVEQGEDIDPKEAKLFHEEILSVCQPYPEELLDFHSVLNIKNRKEMPYIGNVPEITQEYTWEDLDYSRVLK